MSRFRFNSVVAQQYQEARESRRAILRAEPTSLAAGRAAHATRFAVPIRLSAVARRLEDAECPRRVAIIKRGKKLPDHAKGLALPGQRSNGAIGHR
jgi:hypothetical protein